MSLKVLIVEDQFLEARSLSTMLKNGGHAVEGIAKSVEQALLILDKKKPEIVLVDILLKGEANGIDLARVLDRRNIPFIYISANSNTSTLEEAVATKPYGFLVKPFKERQILIALNIAAYRYRKHQEFISRQQKWLTSLLKNIIATDETKDEMVLSLIRALTSFLPFDFIMIDTDLRDSAAGAFFRYRRVDFDEYIRVDDDGDTINDIRKANRENRSAYFLDEADLRKEGFKSKLWVPLLKHWDVEMSIAFYCCNEEKYTADHLQLMNSVQELLGEVVGHIKTANAASRPGHKRNRSMAPNQLLQPKVGGIIGKSVKLLEALDKVSQVAPFDNTVLILGETGVGKEGLVKAIHQLSPRKDKSLVKVNCAAIPANLVESELFGHEKGAFTGAIEQRIGKFEQAHGGTLFLDEIGELPIDIQSKLLRAIQEKEIERVGGRTTIRTDVRIVVATNRNLLLEIAEGRFRLDLYYRINVFPIKLPPLRERREDINALASHFLQLYGDKINRGRMTITPEAMQQLENYSWPGNIRELQHLIERHVLQCRTGIIDRFDMPEPIPFQHWSKDVRELKSFADMDRDHIITALKRCNGKISGRGGAAELLSLPPTTLNSKMKRLGIKWPLSKA
ncbi:regulatory Fis family protein [Dinghuibacter silviterrae]|uniref:Regulatory Fis family protein n=2 Tax=Dinghuibacter silviterrae TaxID=1539049 RepID=A0A4R8DG69_9BACT|nr:regulatory Fis family protein [Dinghuibacter silviterrae]